MPSILLQTLQPALPADHRWRFGPYDFFRKSAASSVKHRLTDDPGEAAIIFFCDGGPIPYFRTALRNPHFKKYPQKCFFFEQGDQPLALLPGVYASIEKRWYDPRWVRSGFYVHINDCDRFETQPWPDETPLLFSFAGSCSNAAVRESLPALRHPRFQLADSSGKVNRAFMTGDPSAIQQLNHTYADLVRRSSFVLCPRGVGCSSQRIFEVMSMGRCPVILADDWVPPVGPEWARFSLTVPESRVLELPDILAPLEASARQMGAIARQQWEQWFAPDKLFDTCVDWCLEIQRAGKCDDPWFRRRKYFQFLRPYHARYVMRLLKGRLLSRGGKN